MSTPYLCPAGFDCIYANSCPSLTVECPSGFFCNSYANSPYEMDLDIKYGKWKTRLSRSKQITEDTRLEFIEPTRIVTYECPSGFYCPNATTIVPCPTGYTCPEGSLRPIQCDDLSLCNEKSTFQLNFIDFLIAGLVTLIVTFLAVRQNRKQRTAEARSRTQKAIPPHEAVIVKPLNSTTPSSTSRTDSASAASSTTTPLGLSFTFNDIGVTVKGHPHHNRTGDASSSSTSISVIDILSQITGTVNAGKFAALMGPTACGKSTLLHVLRSGGTLASSGTLEVRSHVLVTNGTTSQVHQDIIHGTELSRRIGFVPQEDILDRSLTVRELFTFNARARQPFGTSPERINEIVYATLADLGLLGCADTVIGGSANAAANISGGQLKRVNIGCELVALQRPAALLLDEPTSGLDASIANEVCETLAKLTTQGITVLMIVQQPRPEIFERFQHLLLMQHGRIVYEGESNRAAQYFTSLGYPQPNDASDADYCIDVLTGIVSCQTVSSIKTKGSKRYRLAEAWASRAKESGSIPSSAAATSPSFASDVNPLWSIGKGTTTVPSLSSLSTASSAAPFSSESVDWRNELRSFLYLTYLNAQRGLVTRLRNTRNLIIYGSLHVLMAISLSSGFTVYIQQTYRNTLDIPVREELVNYCPTVLRDFCANRNQLDLGFAQLLFFISTAVGSASALSAIPLFGGQIDLVKREVNNGLSSIAYCFGRMITDTLIVLMNGLIFSGVWLLFGHAGHYYNWLGVILPTAYATAGIGYTAAVLTRPVNAAVITLIAITAFSVFSGVEPTLTSVKPLHILNWFWYLSFASYSAEGTYVTWVDSFRENPDAWKRVLKGAETFGYNLDSQANSIGALIALGLAWRILAITILYYRTKSPTYNRK